MGAISRLTLGALLVMTLVWAPGTPVAHAADPDVVFVGSGWGHGVGMSQYGAYAMATLGHDYEAILTHYYQGTSVESIDPLTPIWVNLESDFSTRTLSVLNVGGSPGSNVSITSSAGSRTAEPGDSIAVSEVASSGCLVVVSGEPELTIAENCSVDLSWYAWATPGMNPSTKIEIQGCTLPDWNVSPTLWRPCQYARGQLHLRHGDGGLDLSAEMLLNDYVLGISEVPHSWPPHALRAQAVAARSYAQARRLTRGDPTPADDNGCWCHVRDSTSDQRYVGWGHSQTGGYWISASNETASEVVTHPDSGLGGDVITTYYSSSSGGATEYGHLKGFASSQVEWLSSVYDGWAVDGTVPNPNDSWSVNVDSSTIASAAGLDLLTSMKVSQTRAGSGSVSEVEIKGLLNGQLVTVKKTGTWVRQTFDLKSEYFTVNYAAPLHPLGDELLLYKTDGTFRYNSLTANGDLGVPILSGSNYTSGWKSITAVDLDGDGQDEIMFYRDDGLFRYYEIHASGHVGSPLQGGTNYTTGWDSITAIDLNGDGRDEMFFYRDDGLYRYYNITADGRIGSPIASGDEYTKGWDSITAVDLDGDGQDEMFFYREDGLYRYYNISANGHIGSPIASGDEYTTGWDSIRAVDLDGDGEDEMFFYREDGLFRFYDIKPNASLPSPINSGSDFPPGWSVMTPINLDGQ
jgi:SpoIID/LytB domain protein